MPIRLVYPGRIVEHSRWKDEGYHLKGQVGRRDHTLLGMEAAGHGVDISVEPDCQDKHFHLCHLEHIPNVSVPRFPRRCYCNQEFSLFEVN